jgi:hypothetical protein
MDSYAQSGALSCNATTIAMFKYEQRSFKKVASMVPSKRQNDFGHSMEDLTYE